MENNPTYFSFVSDLTFTKSQEERTSQVLLEIKVLLSDYVQFMMKHYATALANRLIAVLNIDSQCTEGMCYYTMCQNNYCKVLYCQYHLITGTKTCTTRKPIDVFKQSKLHSSSNANLNQVTSDNTEDNNIRIYNKILN